jgi:hypothetical protein
VARARFFPSVNLSAGVGLEAFNTNYLLDTPESMLYRAGGDLVAPILNRKAIRADYMSANARQIQAVYEYQQTVLNAYVEVVNRMSKVENYGQSINIKKEQLASLEASVDNATKLFQNARAEYMEVLLAQRDMMEAKMVLIETKQQQLAAIVNTYQALGGGGWMPNGLTMDDIVCNPLPPIEEIPLIESESLDDATPAGGIPNPTTQEATQPEVLPGPEADIKDVNQPSTETDAPPPIPDPLREDKESSLHVLPEPLAAAGS